MSFIRKRIVHHMTWAEDHELHELNVFVLIDSVASELGVLLHLKDVSNNDLTPFSIAQLAKLFVGDLVGWDLQYPDESPVPPTIEGLLGHDRPFVLEVVLPWRDLVLQKLLGGSEQPAESLEEADEEGTEPNEAIAALDVTAIDLPVQESDVA